MSENEATGASVDKGDKPEEDWRKKAKEREIGKCPACGRIIRYQDVEGWEASPRYLGFPILITSVHSGNPLSFILANFLVFYKINHMGRQLWTGI